MLLKLACCNVEDFSKLLSIRKPPEQLTWLQGLFRRRTQWRPTMAAPQGFEPRYHDPESCVLPLNEGAKSGGEGGIRTLGRSYPLQQLSRLPPSATRSPLQNILAAAVAWPRRPKKSICGGGRGTRTPKGVNPAVFKTAALPIRSSPPKTFFL